MHYGILHIIQMILNPIDSLSIYLYADPNDILRMDSLGFYLKSDQNHFIQCVFQCLYTVAAIASLSLSHMVLNRLLLK